MRLADALKPAPVQANGRCAGDGWHVDTDALARAARRLGLTMPVRVAVTNGRGGKRKGGLHYVTRGEHVISVLRRYSPERASEILWHELEHACQSEALGEDRFADDYRAETRAHGYDRNRFEVAARRAERRHTVWFALTVAS